MAKFEFNEWIILWLLEQNNFTFQWDDGNRTKNQDKHDITCEEAESVFKNISKIRVLGLQTSPIANETRYGAFGTTDTNKSVLVCFTVKEGVLIRVISIRILYRKEIGAYEKLCEE